MTSEADSGSGGGSCAASSSSTRAAARSPMVRLPRAAHAECPSRSLSDGYQRSR